MTMSENQKFDFRAMGQAIKNARMDKGWTREELAQIVDISPRYIMAIENHGQHPSFQVFINLMTLFHISIDQFVFPDEDSRKSAMRLLLDAELNELDENDYEILLATAKALKKVKTDKKDTMDR